MSDAKALERSLAILKATLDATADGILVVDENGTIVMHNKRFAEIWRYPPGPVAAGDMMKWALSQVADPVAFGETVRDMYAAKDAESFHEIRLLDGRVFERYSRPCWIDGKPSGRVVSLRDVTRTRTTLDRLAAAHRVAKLGSWEMSVPARTLSCSETMFALCGAPPHAAPAPVEAFFEHVHAKDRDRVRQEILGAKPGGSPSPIAHTIVRDDGAECEVETQIHPEFDASGRLVHVLGTTQDVTSQRQLQERLLVSERMASVGTITAGVGHEINNPLAVVLANVALALESLHANAPREETIAVLEDAKDAAERISKIVQDLRAFSRTESPAIESLDVHQAIDSSARMAWNEVRHRARLVKAYAGDALFVDGSESRLCQVLLNLLVNAAQAIPEGHAEQNEVRVETGRDGEGHVFIKVSDTGKGIAPEQMKHLFVPFFTTKPAGIGTGLGLAICRRIIEEMRGTIDAASDGEGRGATFTVTLPASLASAPEERVPSDAPVSSRVRGRILVVDDEPLVFNVVRRALRSEHDVQGMTDAREAVAMIERGDRFDLILSDLMMPEMTGMDFYAAVKNASPDQARRMAFLTGGAFTESARRFMEETSQPTLEKPFTPRALRKVVEGILSRAQGTREAG